MPCGLVRFSFLFCLACLCLALSGCGDLQEPESDPFMDRWRELAEQSRGRSPAPAPRPADVSETTIERVPLEEIYGAEEKPLPTTRVSLKMHDADVRIVLQALARAANQNILIHSGVEGTVNINIRATPWDQVFRGILKSQKLDYAWEGDILRVMTLEDIQHERAMQEEQLKIKRVEPLFTSVIKVNYADAATLKDNLVQVLSTDEEGNPRGAVTVDAHTNSLIVRAIREDVLRIFDLVNRLDKPRRQIHIQANIVETTQEIGRDLGVQWGGLYRSNQLFGSKDRFYLGGAGSETDGAADPAQGGYSPYFGAGVSGQGLGVNFPVSGLETAGVGTAGAAVGLMYGKIGESILELQLSALQEAGKLNILSSPTITTLDNQMAFTENGERIPYVTTDEEGDKEVKFEDAVLRLEITPHVIDDTNMKLGIVITKDEVDFTRTVDGNPVIIKKKTETTLVVRDGETIVISGLTRKRNSDATSGVPGFKDVPVLGWLFKGESRSKTMEEVLIFITPSILDVGAGAAGALSPEEDRPSLAPESAE